MLLSVGLLFFVWPYVDSPVSTAVPSLAPPPPPPPPVSKLGAVLTMVSGDKARKMFPPHAMGLWTNFFKRFPGRYDFVVFHAADVDPSWILEHIPRQLHSSCRIHDVSNAWGPAPNLPTSLDPASLKRDACANQYSLDYLHGNYFWTVYLFQDPQMQSVLKKYRFIWKLDADAVLHRPVPFDYFSMMLRKQKDFAYYVKTSQSEKPECHQKVMEFLERSATKHNLSWKHRDRIKPRTIFWGFCWILSTKLALSQEFLSLVKDIHESGGIYEHRWDAQNLFPGMMALLTEGKNLLWMKDLRLIHQGEPVPYDEK